MSQVVAYACYETNSLNYFNVDTENFVQICPQFFFEFSCAARPTNKSTNNLAYSLVVGKSHKNITFHQEGSRGWIFTKFVEGRGRLADIISCDEFRAISSRVSISQGSTHWSFPVENLYMMIAVVGVG